MCRYFIPFYDWIMFCYTNISHLFIHTPVDEYLGCFHLLTIINNAIMNIVFRFLYEHMFLFLLGIYPRVEWSGQIITLCLTEELWTCFPKWWHYFTFRPAVHESYSFFISFPVFAIVIFSLACFFFFFFFLILGTIITDCAKKIREENLAMC